MDYILILNIPPKFHSADLRNFFSDFVETEKFSCFHFRHRPQSEVVSIEQNNQRQGIDTTNIIQPEKNSRYLIENSVCCLVTCPNSAVKIQTIKKYHFQHWVDREDQILTSRCIITSVKVNSEMINLPIPSLCILPKKLEVELPQQKLENMFELKPPVLMPQGNVGTPTKHFLALISTCQLPSKLIGKLGLNFPKSRTRKYGSVPFDYGNKILGGSWLSSPTNKSAASRIQERNERIEDNQAEEEEWDRHEALHDDVTEQERNKERLYEEEEEVVWEKGGPGIVWYTDAQLWKEAEGDFDEQTTDDWDVDYSVYFEENGGDKDARDAVEMRRSTMNRQGDLMESVFKKPQTPSGGLPFSARQIPRHKRNKMHDVGPFEQHTRGIGRRLMERQGWRDGAGLGRSQKGIAKPIESEGQKPRERKGLGYFGEQILPRFGAASLKKSGVFIATVYDVPAETDPPEPLLRRNQPTSLKYRS